MNCPKCESENPAEAKFCGECGAKLEKICPNCNFSNPASFKFCNECGHSLILSSEPTPEALSLNEKLETIQKYLPKGIAEKILAQKGKIEGERKQVTVMFCDMVGFTALSERFDPEDIYPIMDKIFEILIRKVHDYEGMVNKMTGDGIMALFGAPIALEDSPQRAIRSALAIHREMTRFSDNIKGHIEDIQPIKMRVGIHSGPVVVGTIGNNLRVEFTAVGDTVNLASRMEGLAEPGTIYVSDKIFKLTEGLFRFENQGQKKVKGKKQPVTVYRVISPSMRRTRFDVNAERGLTSFIGRKRELDFLLDGFDKVKAGRGQAFSIISEAGIGKSRLLYEFRKAVINEDVTFLEGKCLSYSKNVPYHPVIDILKANFEIKDDDQDAVVEKKLRIGLKTLKADENLFLPALLEILSANYSGKKISAMSPEAKRDIIIKIVMRISLLGAELKLLIIAIEDLHWIDESTKCYLKSMLENISGARILLIMTYRPEFSHGWDIKSYHKQINLNRLCKNEAHSIVKSILGSKQISEQLMEVIVDKTDGIPFFIEEYINSLENLHIIHKDKTGFYLIENSKNILISSTIQDVIMARVDSLPEDAKYVLKAGSVIEREFSYDLIKHVINIPEEDLLAHLSSLKYSEFLYERGIFPENKYIFKHALTRDVIYGSILTKRKKSLHEKIGNAIEELNKDNIFRHCEVLVNHFINSDNYYKGSKYSKFASKKSLKSGSIKDAILYENFRINCLEKLPQTEDVKKKIIDSRVTLGLYYNQTQEYILSNKVIKPVVESAKKFKYKKRIAQINLIIGTYSWAVEENINRSIKFLEKAISTTKRENDFITLIMANHYIGHILSDNCEFGKALYYLNNALKIVEAANLLPGISIHKSCIARTIHFFKGDIDLSYSTSVEGLRLSDKIDDAFSKAEAYLSFGISCYGKRMLHKAEKYLIKAFDLCDRLNLIGLQALSSFYLGETYFNMYEYQRAKEQYDKTIQNLENFNYAKSFANLNKVCCERVRAVTNNTDIDLDSLFRFKAENKIRLYSGRMCRYIGEILLNIGIKNITNAENWIKKAIEYDKNNLVKFELGLDYLLYAEIFKRRNELFKIKENLGIAIEILKECGASGWVERYEKELATLS